MERTLESTVFVPFLGDFLSIGWVEVELAKKLVVFVPFLGDFLSITSKQMNWYLTEHENVFVPFLGDFLSILSMADAVYLTYSRCFRPLSWGLSFNFSQISPINLGELLFSSPFLGTFFQFDGITLKFDGIPVFVPFLGDFLSMRKRICL